MSTVNFYSACRVCTISSDQNSNIFSPDGKRRNLAAKIAECLSLCIEENDRLPKVLCDNCIQEVENMIAFRNKCKQSQTTLTNWLCQATNTVRLQATAIQNSNGSLNVLQDNNEFSNSFMQVASVQQVVDPSQSPEKLSQYTITLESKAPNTIAIDTQQRPAKKGNQSNALQMITKNIKVTPIRKKVENQQQQQQHQQLQTQQQQEDHTQSQQTQQLYPQTQQQITIQNAQLPMQAAQQTTQIPQHIIPINLQQFLQPQQQQLQHLTTQFQPQPIAISAPTSQAILPTTSNVTTTSTNNDVLSPGTSKKPKINFVLTPSTSTVAQTAVTTTTTGLTQFSSATGSTTITPQSQVPWQFQSTQPVINTLNTLQSQPQQQQHQSHANNSTSHTSLAQLLQQSVGISNPLSTSMLSSNKCFLPITIKDENSDQQIVAHIDTKNFVLPTTYQLQMKVQPQITTSDGQTIMQLTPTSIPALQLTQQDLANHIIQAFLSNSFQHQQQPQIQTQILQPQQQAQQPQSQHIVQQAAQQTLPLTNIQITQQQAGINSNNFINNNINKNDATITVANNEQQQNPDLKSQNPIAQQKYKITQLSGNSIEVTPTTDYEIKKVQTHQQQQQPIVAATQYAGITVRPVMTGKTTANAKTNLQQSIDTTPTTSSTTAVSTISKSNVFNKNVTISRITTQPQQQQTQQIKLVKPTQQQQILKQQPQQQPNSTKIVVQQPTTQQNLLQKQQIRKRPAEHLVTHVETLTPPKKTIRRVATKVETSPILQQYDPTTTTTAAATMSNFNKITKPKLVSTDSNIKIETSALLPTSSSIAPTTTKTGSATATTAAANTSSKLKTSAIKKETKNLSNKTMTTTNSTNATTQNTSGVAAAEGSRFECEQCHHVFKKKEHLNQHAKAHTGLRPFQCKEPGCGKDFVRREHLQRHTSSHTGEKSFVCEVCQKPFSRKDNLKKHIRIHTSAQNSSQYSCDICNKSFTVKTEYDDHMQLHVKQDIKSESPQKKKQVGNKNVQQSTATVLQTQQTTQQIQITHPQQQQPQQQPQQIMHLKFPSGMTTQGLAGNTITITESNDPNKGITTHDGNVYLHLGQTQFIDTVTGQVYKINNK